MTRSLAPEPEKDLFRDGTFDGAQSSYIGLGLAAADGWRKRREEMTMKRAGVMRRSERPGFTMVELLTVIAIIAILAGILFPVFVTVRKNVHKATCTSNLHQIGVGLKLYKDDHGAYPEALYGFRAPAA